MNDEIPKIYENGIAQTPSFNIGRHEIEHEVRFIGDRTADKLARILGHIDLNIFCEIIGVGTIDCLIINIGTTVGTLQKLRGP